MQEARHVHAVGDGELLPVLAADTAAAIPGTTGAGERLVEIHDEEAVVDEHLLAFTDVARRNAIAIRVVAQVRIAGMFDQVIGIGHEADVHGAENLVEVGVETVAAEQRLGVGGKLLNLAPAEAYPA